jgi:hypothetical protein
MHEDDGRRGVEQRREPEAREREARIDERYDERRGADGTVPADREARETDG